jgi:hypothetical protein
MMRWQACIDVAEWAGVVGVVSSLIIFIRHLM